MTQWGLDTIFNPAKRHMDDEKRRLQSTREEVGDNSGGRRIDLESGKVRIAASDAAAADEVDDTGAADETADTAQAHEPAQDVQAKAKAKRSAAPPTPAQVRAAARRGRTLE